MKKSGFSHFNTSNIVEESDDYKSYNMITENGDGRAEVHWLTAGVEVVLLDVQASHYVPELHKAENILEINHCLEGRAECIMHDGCSQYIGEGDLFLSGLHNHSAKVEFPLGYYKGIIIIVDLDKASVEINNLLSDIPFEASEILNRLFVNDECFLIQANDAIKHIFVDMYTIPKEARNIYFRLKVLQLFIYLHYFDVASEKQKGVYTRQQVDIAKQVQKKMIKMLDCRFTIDELAWEYCISPTALKSYFKGVYGKSIAAYMKEYRIRYASSLLRESNESIKDIALAVGYESQSKFGAAFKEVMEITPMKYRKKYM